MTLPAASINRVDRDRNKYSHDLEDRDTSSPFSMPQSHQGVRQVILAIKMLSSETCSRVFDASWISESFLRNSGCLRVRVRPRASEASKWLYYCVVGGGKREEML